MSHTATGHAPASQEPPTETVEFDAQYLSYFPGDKAAFAADDATAIKAQMALNKSNPLTRVEQPPHGAVSPKDYDPQHKDLGDPTKPAASTNQVAAKPAAAPAATAARR